MPCSRHRVLLDNEYQGTSYPQVSYKITTAAISDTTPGAAPKKKRKSTLIILIITLLKVQSYHHTILICGETLLSHHVHYPFCLTQPLYDKCSPLIYKTIELSYLMQGFPNVLLHAKVVHPMDVLAHP